MINKKTIHFQTIINRGKSVILIALFEKIPVLPKNTLLWVILIIVDIKILSTKHI